MTQRRAGGRPRGDEADLHPHAGRCASVDVATKEPRKAFKERSDICAVPAAAVVGEAAVAFVLAQALLEKFGGDSIDHDAAVERYRAEVGR